jgi:saccharopine dehydrogenase (NAD+, L-lysine forming)
LGAQVRVKPTKTSISAGLSPRDVVAVCLPNPATLGPKMRGKTRAGVWVTGTGKDGNPRSTCL